MNSEKSAQQKLKKRSTILKIQDEIQNLDEGMDTPMVKFMVYVMYYLKDIAKKVLVGVFIVASLISFRSIFHTAEFEHEFLTILNNHAEFSRVGLFAYLSFAIGGFLGCVVFLIGFVTDILFYFLLHKKQTK